jgi:hypothetical protein
MSISNTREIENLRIIIAEEKMTATPAPFSGALLFSLSGVPLLRVSKILTSRCNSNEPKETRHYIMKKVAH